MQPFNHMAYSMKQYTIPVLTCNLRTTTIGRIRWIAVLKQLNFDSQLNSYSDISLDVFGV